MLYRCRRSTENKYNYLCVFVVLSNLKFCYISYFYEMCSQLLYSVILANI